MMTPRHQAPCEAHTPTCMYHTSKLMLVQQHPSADGMVYPWFGCGRLRLYMWDPTGPANSNHLQMAWCAFKPTPNILVFSRLACRFSTYLLENPQKNPKDMLPGCFQPYNTSKQLFCRGSPGSARLTSWLRTTSLRLLASRNLRVMSGPNCSPTPRLLSCRRTNTRTNTRNSKLYTKRVTHSHAGSSIVGTQQQRRCFSYFVVGLL